MKMSLRRLSTMLDRDRLLMPERMEPPRSAGKKTSNFAVLKKQAPNFQLVRLLPQKSAAKPGNERRPTHTIQPRGLSVAGQSLRLTPTPLPNRDTRDTADEFDGISVLPSTLVKPHSRGTTTKKQQGTTQAKSQIPQRSGPSLTTSGLSKRKSFLKAKKRLSMSQKRTVKRSLNNVLQAPSGSSPHASCTSADSTAQFEADELATEMPTPAPNRVRAASSYPCNCTDSLKEMKILHKDMVKAQKEFLARQTEALEEQKVLIRNQTDVLTKLNTLIDNNMKFFNPVCADNHDLSMESTKDEIEKNFRDVNQSVIGERAALQYDDIRSGFNFLRLKTPAKSVAAAAVTPKTPKSLLSRTLQMQLGDIFEAS